MVRWRRSIPCWWQYYACTWGLNRDDGPWVGRGCNRIPWLEQGSLNEQWNKPWLFAVYPRCSLNLDLFEVIFYGFYHGFLIIFKATILGVFFWFTFSIRILCRIQVNGGPILGEFSTWAPCVYHLPDPILHMVRAKGLSQTRWGVVVSLHQAVAKPCKVTTNPLSKLEDPLGFTSLVIIHTKITYHLGAGNSNIFGSFIPILGEMIQFDEHIISKGLVQPPPSKMYGKLGFSLKNSNLILKCMVKFEGFSLKNGGFLKWWYPKMVYNGTPFLKWMIWGYHHFRKPPSSAWSLGWCVICAKGRTDSHCLFWQ